MKTLAVLALLALPPGARAGEIRAAVQDKDGKPVPEAVVFVYEVPGGKFDPPGDPAVMDQIDKEYVPHVLAVLAGAKVRFPNKDNIHHHVYSFSKGKKFELPLYKDEPADPVTFDKPGVVKLGCNIHDWMLGYVLVLDNPYFAATDSGGRARVAEVPKGRYELAVWSERLKGPVEETRQTVEVGDQAVQAVFKPKLGPAPKRKRASVADY